MVRIAELIETRVFKEPSWKSPILYVLVDVFSRRTLYCGRAGSDVIGCHRPTGCVFICMLQTRVTLTAFPIVTPRGRSSKFPWRGTGVFVRNKCIKTLNRLKCESYIHNDAFCSEKVVSSESGEKFAQISTVYVKTVLNKYVDGFYYERTQGGLFQWKKCYNGIWTEAMVVDCGLLWTCFYQLFGLSFWRHPFTAEDSKGPFTPSTITIKITIKI